MNLLKKEMWLTNQEKNIRTKFSIILFVCSIIVIFIHTYNLEVYGIDEHSSGFSQVVFQVESYWSKVTRIAVPMFFMVSGILFFRTFEISKLIEKWKKRVSTVLIPYFIWCTLYYLYFVLCTNHPVISSYMNGGTKIEVSLREWVSWLWVNEYYTLWFLKNLIVFILLTPVIWLLLKNHYKKIPTGFVLLVILLLIKYRVGDKYSYLNGIEMYLVGSYIGLNGRGAISKKNKVVSIISLLYIGVTIVSAFRLWNPVTEILFYIAIWYALDLIDIAQVTIPWWMKITFFTYVAHDVLLETAEKLLLIVGGKSAYMALVDYIFMPLAVELVLIIIAYFMRKRTHVIWNVITGGR